MAFTRKADCKEVVANLEHAETLSIEVRSMLSNGLSLAVKADPASRHPYQADVIAMAKDALLAEEKAVSEKKAEIAGRVAAAEAAFEACKTRMEDVHSAFEKASEEAQRKSQAAQAAAADASKAEVQHAQCNAAQEKVSVKVAAAHQKRDSAEAIVECPLKMLVSGSCEDEESTQEAIQAVISFLTEIQADAVLIAGGPAALKNKPTERQGFDEVVVRGISEAVAERRSQLDAAAAALDQELVLVQAEALGLWAIADVDRSTASAATGESQIAEAARTKALEAKKEANKDLTAQQRAVNHLLSEQARHEPRLSTLAAALAAVARLDSQQEYTVAMAMAVEAVPDAACVDDVEDVEMCDAAGVVDLAADAPAVAMVA